LELPWIREAAEGLQMALIDFSFQGAAKVLRLNCRVADGWRQAKKTYCFSEAGKIPWRFDYTLKPRVGVFPYPVSLLSAKAQYVLSSPEKGTFQAIAFELGHQELSVDISLCATNGILNDELPWYKTDSGKLCIAWEHFVQSYRISLLVVFDPPPTGPPLVEREWSRRFFPGGLPSLGKRR
jgi:hypothetical protein